MKGNPGSFVSKKDVASVHMRCLKVRGCMSCLEKVGDGISESEISGSHCPEGRWDSIYKFVRVTCENAHFPFCLTNELQGHYLALNCQPCS